MKVLPTALLFWTLVALTVVVGRKNGLVEIRLPLLRRAIRAPLYCGAALLLGLVTMWSVRPLIASHYASKGNGYERVGMLSEASALYEKGLGLNPRSGELRLARGRMRLLAGDFVGALEDTQEAEASLMDPAIYMLRAEALSELGDRATALTYREIAAVMLPKTARQGSRTSNNAENRKEVPHD